MNYGINECFGSYEVKPKLKLNVSENAIGWRIAVRFPDKNQSFHVNLPPNFNLLISDFPLTRSKKHPQKSKKHPQRTNGTVFKSDISVENDDSSDRQGQSHMKWKQISHLKYHKGNPGKFTVQL